MDSSLDFLQSYRHLFKMRLFFLALFVATAAAVEVVPILSVQDSVPNSYILKIKDGYSVSDIVKRLPEQVTLKRTYDTIFGGVAVEAPRAIIQKLRTVNMIEYIEEDSVMRAVCDWGVDRINQRNLPLDNSCDYYADGAGVNVYIADTGIRYSHNEFSNRAFFFWDFSSGRDGSDCHGHGTHCAGIAIGDQVGAAYRATAYSVRVLNCMGSGLTSNIVAGLNAIAASGPRPGICSMSLGGGASTALDNATRDLIAAGVPTAVAAGNENTNACNSSPARVAEAETVGSTDNTDTRSTFSNFGSCVDIFAPGTNIRSAYHTGDSAYATMSGTSMACPFVAGVMAIYIGSNSCSSPTSCSAHLASEATKGVVRNPGIGSPNNFLYVRPL